MTSRERVLTAIDHREPDRVPLDLGGTVMSGIMAHALDRLRRELGLEDRPVKVYEVFQMLGEVEPDVVDRLGIDVLPIEPPIQFFGLRRSGWKPWKLWDGTGVLVPGQFNVETDADGSLLLRDGGEPDGPVTGRMPAGGFYFDMPASTSSDPSFEPPSLEQVRRKNHLDSETVDFLAARAEHLRRETDKALLLGCWGSFGLPGVGGLPDYLCLMLTDPDYLKALFEIRTETALTNMEKVNAVLGDSIDIIGLEAFDFGTQKTELINPDLFGELFVPYLRIQNDWIHTHTSWKSWQHTCGSVPRIIPHLIETGVDILNPVQTSAAGMDPLQLKERYGDRLTFWGGGVDTQRTLPFGTPEETAAEAAERIRIFAPGGGFVFNPIHNVQQGTPPRNIVAAYDTARTVGRYPIA